MTPEQIKQIAIEEGARVLRLTTGEPSYQLTESELIATAKRIAQMQRESDAKIVDVENDTEAWEIRGGQETIDVLRDMANAIRKNTGE